MNKNKNFIIFGLLAFSLLYSNITKAQYTFSPSKTLIKFQARNSLSYDSIHIANNSNDTLHLRWELILNDTTGGSYFDFCSSGVCWLGIPVSGSFPAILPGSFGWAGYHLWTGNTEVVCTAKIYVYEEGDYNNGDTLSYILHAENPNSIQTTIDTKYLVIVYPNPATDRINISFENNNTEEIIISLYNILGEIIYTTSNVNTFIEIPLINVNNGIYFLKMKSVNRNYNKKILVSR